jgi:hypothetical protein
LNNTDKEPTGLQSDVSFQYGIVFVALGGGILGYHEVEGFTWIDADVNASMILGGMGPVNELHTTVGKLFASIYALFRLGIHCRYGRASCSICTPAATPISWGTCTAREGNTDEQ